jgi:hypothetical protein
MRGWLLAQSNFDIKVGSVFHKGPTEILSEGIF